MNLRLDVLFLLGLATPCTIVHGDRQQSLLQAWTKAQKTHTIIKESAVQVTSEQGDEVQNAPGLKFYMPSLGKACLNTTYPNTRVVPAASGQLKAFSNWLWVVEDEHYDYYVQHRLACSDALVSSAEEADLCYPSCTAKEPLTSTKNNELMSKTADMPSRESDESHSNRTQVSLANVHSDTNSDAKQRWMPHICFEVPLQKRQSWSHCSSLCLQPEATGSCSVEVPYLHGVMWPQQDEQSQGTELLGINGGHANIAPWEFAFNRTTMLAFVGGEHRGRRLDRDVILGAMRTEASQINAASPEAVFSAHIIKQAEGAHENDWYGYGRTPEFYSDTWETYASANFSWQPYGDTSTRRALYDSLMFGCVPVIDTKAADSYRRLFHGVLWNDVALEKMFVVIPEGKEADGKAILQILTSMPADEIDKRRSSLRQIASALQWGGHTPNRGDAFFRALRSFRFSAAANEQGKQSDEKAVLPMLISMPRQDVDKQGSRSIHSSKVQETSVMILFIVGGIGLGVLLCFGKVAQSAMSADTS